MSSTTKIYEEKMNNCVAHLDRELTSIRAGRANPKAIQTSDIGINPIDDGHTIRLVFPAPTEERRKQLTKDVQKQGEEAKIAVRNVRRDAMDKFKAQKKAGELTEDDQKNLEEEVQKLTDKFIKEIDATCARKNQEIMEV